MNRVHRTPFFYLPLILGGVFIWVSVMVFLPRALAETTSPQPPIKFRLEPTKRIFTSREGVRVKLVFTATQRTKLCLKKDVLSHLSIDVYRAGQRVLMQPLTVKDTSVLFKQTPKVYWLEAGDSLVRMASLKRYTFKDGSAWFPAEYSVSGRFDLCEQNDRNEVDLLEDAIPVEAEHDAWFMIMS